MQSQNESGFCDVDSTSDVTASSHYRSKQVHSPNSTEFLTYSSDLSGAPPVIGRYLNMQRSASVEDTSAQDHVSPADVLAAHNKTPQLHRSKLPNTKYRMATSLSQDTFNSDFRQPFNHPPSLSQSSHPPRSYHHQPYYRKPGSPASSSDTSSMTSSVAHRLGSGPGSVVSFTTDSSTQSTSRGLLPRPQSLASSSGSGTSVLSKPGYPMGGDFSQRSNSSYAPSLAPTYDSDNDEEQHAIQPSPKHSWEGGASSRRQNVQLRKHHLYEKHGSSHEMYERRRQGKMQLNQPRIPEEGSERDSFTMKLEIVLSVLSLVLSNKDQTDADAARMLLALSQSPETCSVMRQSACMNMLIQIMHNIDRKGEKSHREVRTKAAEALRNIVESTAETRQGRYELCVLAMLEKTRGHCDATFEFVHSIPSTRKVEASERESLQNACDFLLQPVKKLYKYSNEKDHYRPAVLSLGGLQATAELLVVNFRLMTSQKASDEKPVCHSTRTMAVAISILVNLTYGDVHNKSTLCMFPDLLKALMHHLKLKQETIIASGAQLLRNLSWKATADIKDSLLKCDASVVLIDALQHVKDEQTIQHITSALWNLSAHSMENRNKVCTTRNGLKHLVELLSYNSPTGTTAVVENVGGILKNLSVVIMQEEGYRKKFRRSGGLGKLVQHLKSKNRTVLANATGILWNLSARFPEDQKVLWDLGCVPLLDVLQTANQKNIAEYARGALRNLLAFGRTNGWTSKSDVTAYNIKTQRELSKSLSYAANQVFNNPSSQSKQSNESLHSRRSQPTKIVGGDIPLDQIPSNIEQSASAGSVRDSVRTLRPCDSKDGGDSSGDEEYIKMEKNRLKINRVASVPETVLDQKTSEWSMYRPGQQNISMASQGFPGEVVIDARRKKTSRGAHRGRDHSARSLSQSESYHLSSTSNSDAQSGSAASFSHEPEEAPSLLPYPYDPKLEGAVYSDLEVDDDEIDNIDQPLQLEEHTVDNGYGRMHGWKYGNRERETQPSGTSTLALDGYEQNGESKVTSV